MLFAFVGEAGQAILFLCTLTGLAVVSFYVLAYAAHCLLVVVQETAVGYDEVVWPRDSMLDWLGSALQLMGLVVLWLVPAGFLTRGLQNELFPDNPPLRFLVLAVPALWLFFPLTLFSSLSATSSWVLLRPSMVVAFFRVLPSLFFFYPVTALLAGAALYPWYLALVAGRVYFLPLAAFGGAALWLIYARLLGRLGWLIARLPPWPAPESEDRLPSSRKSHPGKMRVEVHDPWAVPEEFQEEPKVNLPVEGYELAPEERKPRKKRPRPDAPSRPPVEGYALSEETPSSAEAEPLPKRAPIPSEPKAVSVLELRLREGTPLPAPPAFPLLSGVYTFPWYGHSLRAWAWLSLCGLFLGLGALALIYFYPA